jgi:hypothetical protein
LPGWYATRLHAVPEGKEIPKGQVSIQAECGAWVYGVAPTDWAQRKVEKGPPRCKRCEKLTSAELGVERNSIRHSSFIIKQDFDTGRLVNKINEPRQIVR